MKMTIMIKKHFLKKDYKNTKNLTNISKNVNENYSLIIELKMSKKKAKHINMNKVLGVL